MTTESQRQVYALIEAELLRPYQINAQQPSPYAPIRLNNTQNYQLPDWYNPEDDFDYTNY